MVRPPLQRLYFFLAAFLFFCSLLEYFLAGGEATLTITFDCTMAFAFIGYAILLRNEFDGLNLFAIVLLLVWIFICIWRIYEWMEKGEYALSEEARDHPALFRSAEKTAVAFLVLYFTKALCGIVALMLEILFGKSPQEEQ